MALLHVENGSSPDEIRTAFVSTVTLDASEFLPGDVEKFLASDELLLRFHRHQKGDLNETVKMMERFLKWRKSFGIDTLTEADISREFFERGSIYVKGYTKEGNEVLWIHGSKWRKGKDINDGSKLMAMVFEKILWDEKRPHAAQVPKGSLYFVQLCLVLDMVGAGFSNLDMEIMRFAVNCIQNMYPQIAQVIIPFQMPFIFRAAWKVIQSWLRPESREKIQFCGPNNIDRFIDLSNVPRHMGGTSDYIYNYQLTGIANPDTTDATTTTTTEQANTPDYSQD